MAYRRYMDMQAILIIDKTLDVYSDDTKELGGTGRPRRDKPALKRNHSTE